MRAATIAESGTADNVHAVSKRYRRYMIAVLLVIYILNFLDRQIVSILAEHIKNDLQLADWQLGVMTGLAFALFYTVVGFPVARLAERGDRPLIIATAVGIWSFFTAASGAAQNFWHLVLARVGVGVGEAGCLPPAVSLIGDITPKDQRASAMAIYSVGAPVGGLLGMIIGGIVADAWGWRAAFVIVGLPGLSMGIIAAATLHEPRRRMRAEMLQQKERAQPFREALQEMRRSRTLWRLIVGGSLKVFVAFGMTAFLASFFLRNHASELAATAARLGLESTGFLGLALGLTAGGSSVIGTLLGGALVDRFVKRDIRFYVRIPAFGMLLAPGFYIAAFLQSSLMASLALLVIPSVLMHLWSGPIYATIQGIMRPEVRATATATLLFCTNLVGLGCGPLAVGLVSDLIANGLHLGAAEGVKWSLATFTLLGIPGAIIYWSSAKHIRAELVH